MEHNYPSVKRSFFFEYYDLGKESEPDEKESGGIEGGKTFPSNIAMLRVKLGLSDKEIMSRPWILTQIESCDFPNYVPNKKKSIKNPKEIPAYLMSK